MKLRYDYVYSEVLCVKTVDISLATYHMTLSWDYFRSGKKKKCFAMEISKIMSLHENFSQVECEDGKNIEATEIA